MFWSEPALVISLTAVSAALIAAALMLTVRWHKNRKWKPSKGERRILRGLDEHTAHADEVATPTERELEPEPEPLERLRGSVRHYDRPTDPVADTD